MNQRPRQMYLNLFSPAVIGIPIIVFGILYFALFGDRLLPNRNLELVDSEISDPRQYAVSMKIEPGGVLSGKTISKSGILKLNYSLLSEVRTAGKIFTSIRSNRIFKRQ